MAEIRCVSCREVIRNTLDTCPHCGERVLKPRGGFLATSEIDWVECRKLVDDYQRALLEGMAVRTPAANARAHSKMDRIDEMRERLPEVEELAFMNMVTKAMQDAQADPNRERLRLGMPIVGTTTQPVASQRMGLRELAVRTAVRATVWESVKGVFRIFR